MGKYCRNLFLVVRRLCFIHKRVNMIKLYFGLAHTSSGWKLPNRTRIDAFKVQLTRRGTEIKAAHKHKLMDRSLRPSISFLSACLRTTSPISRCRGSVLSWHGTIMSVNLVVSQLISTGCIIYLYGLSSGRHRMIPCSHRTLSNSDRIHSIPRVPDAPWNHHRTVTVGCCHSNRRN